MKPSGVTRSSPSAGRQRFEDALRGADRGARVARADLRDEVVVFGQALIFVGASAAFEVGGVGGVGALVLGGDRGDRLAHRARRVPLVRVVARFEAEQVADVDHGAAGAGVGVEQLRRPFVVADPVDDRDLRLGHRPRVFGARFVVVGVGGGVGDDARHRDPVAAELGGDAAPGVLGGNHVQLAAAAFGGVGAPPQPPRAAAASARARARSTASGARAGKNALLSVESRGAFGGAPPVGYTGHPTRY